jgi:taurine transport system permease protein
VKPDPANRKGAVLVNPALNRHPRRLPRGLQSLLGAATFVAPLFALVLIWAIVVPLFGIDPRVFPSVAAVAGAGLEAIRDGSLIQHIGASLLRVGLGTLIGIATAVPLGIAMGVSPAVSTFLTPLFRFFSVLAGIAWIPIATLWFGYGFGAIVFVIFNAVFFVVAYNTLLGVSTIPLVLRNAAASLGAGRWALLTEVLLPGALPNIVTGIRTGLGFAWRGLIAAEMIATNVGLGYMLFVARDFYRTEVIILGMIVIGAIWLLIDRLLLVPLERSTIERWGMVRRA